MNLRLKKFQTLKKLNFEYVWGQAALVHKDVQIDSYSFHTASLSANPFHLYV